MTRPAGVRLGEDRSYTDRARRILRPRFKLSDVLKTIEGIIQLE